MKLRNIMAAAAVLSLAATPAIAEGAYAPSEAPVEGESKLSGKDKGSTIIVAILAASAVIAGVIVAAGSDDTPTSS